MAESAHCRRNVFPPAATVPAQRPLERRPTTLAHPYDVWKVAPLMTPFPWQLPKALRAAYRKELPLCGMLTVAPPASRQRPVRLKPLALGAAPDAAAGGRTDWVDGPGTPGTTRLMLDLAGTVIPAIGNCWITVSRRALERGFHSRLPSVPKASLPTQSGLTAGS